MGGREHGSTAERDIVRGRAQARNTFNDPASDSVGFGFGLKLREEQFGEQEVSKVVDSDLELQALFCLAERRDHDLVR